MKSAEWLALPKRVRWWRSLFCKHPFALSTKVGTVADPSRYTGDVGFQFVVNVRRCGSCRSYFLDAGLERETWAQWDARRKSAREK